MGLRIHKSTVAGPLSPPLRHQLDEETLAVAVRAGDHDAFTVLHERHRPGMLRVCRRVLGSDADAEDMVQLALASAWTQLRDPDRPLPHAVRPWLYTIAQRRCVDHIRTRRPQVLEDRHHGCAPEVAAGRAELRATIADVRDLPEDQRQALVLSVLAGLSQTQIAHVFEREPAHVGSLVHQARQTLKDWRTARDMPCAVVREHLLGGAPPAVRRRVVQRHLRLCAPCREVHARVRQERSVRAWTPWFGLAGLKKVMALLGLGAGAGSGGAATVVVGTFAVLAPGPILDIRASTRSPAGPTADGQTTLPALRPARISHTHPHAVSEPTAAASRAASMPVLRRSVLADPVPVTTRRRRPPAPPSAAPQRDRLIASAPRAAEPPPRSAVAATPAAAAGRPPAPARVAVAADPPSDVRPSAPAEVPEPPSDARPPAPAAVPDPPSKSKPASPPPPPRPEAAPAAKQPRPAAGPASPAPHAAAQTNVGKPTSSPPPAPSERGGGAPTR